MAESFIGDVTEFILKTRQIPTTKFWAENIAGQILTTCTLRCLCTPNRWSPLKGIPFNSADINVSPSGVWFKGLPVDNVALPIINKFVTLLNEHPKDQYPKLPRHVDLVMPSIMTSPEAMTDFLFQNEYCLDWKEEITTVFKASSGRRETYEPKIEFYTNLIDCHRLKRRRLKSRTPKGEDPEQWHWYVEDYRYNLIGATTSYLFDVVDKYIFTQGFAPRVCWEWNEGVNPKKPPEEIFDRVYEPEEEQAKIREYAEFLVELNRWIALKEYPFIVATYTVNPIIHDFMIKMGNVEGQDTMDAVDTNMIRSVQARQWLHAIKCAQKAVIGRLWGEWHRYNELVYTSASGMNLRVPEEAFFIGEKEVKWGIRKVLHSLKCVRTMLDRWDKRIDERMQAKRISKRQRQGNRRLAKIMDMLNRAGARGCTETRLTHALGVSCKPYVRKLKRLGQARCTKQKLNPLDKKASKIWRLTSY